MRASSCVLLVVLLSGVSANPLLNDLKFSWLPLEKQQINLCNILSVNDKGSTFTVGRFTGERCTVDVAKVLSLAADTEKTAPVQPAPTAQPAAQPLPAQPVIQQVPVSPGDLLIAYEDGVVLVGGANPDSVVVEQVTREALTTALPALNTVTAAVNQANRKLML